MLICPSCGIYLSDSHLFKKNVVTTDNGTIIAYDAYCRGCSTDIGRVSWGVLTPAPHLAKSAPEAEAVLPVREGEPESVPSPLRVEPISEKEGKRCPHCGMPI